LKTTWHDQENVMSQILPNFDIGQLSIPQRLDLIAELWDSIPDEASLPIPEAHWQEVERRFAAADRDPSRGIPWQQVRDELRRMS
jgi:putative addiction module component (TIGR02574 family)